MSENEIINMLGDIRYEMFDILGDENDDKLKKVLEIIDKRMSQFRGLTNQDIINKLRKS